MVEIKDVEETAVFPTTPPIPSATPTYTPIPTITPTETPTATPTSTVTPSPTPTPGSPLAFWYQDNGEVYQYIFQTWASEKIQLPSTGSIAEAKISPDGQSLAYHDEEGLRYMPLPQGESIFLAERSMKYQLESFVFSPDSQLLAYTDDTGLYIANLSNDTHTLLWENDTQDHPDITLYEPVSWSADQEWLAIWVGVWEGGWTALGSISTKQIIYPISGCANIEWSPAGSTFGMIVRYFGYLSCNRDDDGVYIAEIDQNEIEEKRIYHETPHSSSYGFPGASYLSQSPDNMQLLFVQEDDIEPESRLMLISPDGTGLTQLVELPIGMLFSPIWGDDSEYIYYVEQTQDTSSLYEISTSTFEKRLIYSATGVTYWFHTLYLSPDGHWLALVNYISHDNIVINLVSVHDDTVIEIATDAIDGVIGWQETSDE